MEEKYLDTVRFQIWDSRVQNLLSPAHNCHFGAMFSKLRSNLQTDSWPSTCDQSHSSFQHRVAEHRVGLHVPCRNPPRNPGNQNLQVCRKIVFFKNKHTNRKIPCSEFPQTEPWNSRETLLHSKAFCFLYLHFGYKKKVPKTNAGNCNTAAAPSSAVLQDPLRVHDFRPLT